VECTFFFSDRFKTSEDPPKYLRGLSLSLFNFNPKEFPKNALFQELNVVCPLMGNCVKFLQIFASSQIVRADVSVMYS